MESEIDAIVNFAYENLGENLTISCIKNDYFTTVVQDSTGKYYPIIDTTKIMPYHVDEYMKTSQELFTKFKSVNRWYNA